MSEVPERIYIGILYADESSSIYTVGMVKDTDVEYIRKDIYDAHSIVDVDRYDKCKLIAQNNEKDRVIQENAKDVQGLKLGLHKAQERIKQLEEALRFYANKENYCVDKINAEVYEYVDRESNKGQLTREIGTLARKVGLAGKKVGEYRRMG